MTRRNKSWKCVCRVFCAVRSGNLVNIHDNVNDNKTGRGIVRQDRVVRGTMGVDSENFVFREPYGPAQSENLLELREGRNLSWFLKVQQHLHHKFSSLQYFEPSFFICKETTHPCRTNDGEVELCVSSN